MRTRTLHTAEGRIRFLPPTPELLRAIRGFLKFGLAQRKRAKQGVRFGIASRCGDQSLFGVRVPLAPQTPENALFTLQMYHLFIANCLGHYLGNGFSGLLVPTPYLRVDPTGKVEPGIFYFGTASARGRETLEYDSEPWDDKLDGAFTMMWLRFIRAISECSFELPVKLPWEDPPVTCHISEIDHLELGFMFVGPHLVCLKPELSETDPIWGFLLKKGIDRMYHVPSALMSIREEDLPHAKKGPDLT